MQSSGMYDAADTMVSENERKANRLLQQTAANLQEKKGRCKALMSSAAFMQLKLRHFCVQMLVQAPHDLGGLELFFRAAEKAPAGGRRQLSQEIGKMRAGVALYATWPAWLSFAATSRACAGCWVFWNRRPAGEESLGRPWGDVLINFGFKGGGVHFRA